MDERLIRLLFFDTCPLYTFLEEEIIQELQKGKNIREIWDNFPDIYKRAWQKVKASAEKLKDKNLLTLIIRRAQLKYIIIKAFENSLDVH